MTVMRIRASKVLAGAVRCDRPVGIVKGMRARESEGHVGSVRRVSPVVAGTERHIPGSERGSGTVLALALVLVLLVAGTSVGLLAQAGVLASRAAAAADLAALAAADAARGLAPGEPCAVAAEVAARNDARISSCSIEGGDTVQVGTELHTRSPFGTATGLARAGPPAGEGTP